MIFGFLGMLDDYEERKVARFEKGKLLVSTAGVRDGDHLYETAVLHPEYNKGKWVIVEAYDSIPAAKKGHAKWVAKMTGEVLPATLTDCANSLISQFAFGSDPSSAVFKRTPATKRRK